MYDINVFVAEEVAMEALRPKGTQNGETRVEKYEEDRGTFSSQKLGKALNKSGKKQTEVANRESGEKR